jgi:hypothetical protein
MKLSRRIRPTAVLLAIGLVSVASAQDGIWVSLGPLGVGSVREFAISDGVVFAAASNGVFRSCDRAESWEPAGLQGQSVSFVATAPGASVIPAVALSRQYATPFCGQSDPNAFPE